MPRTHCRVNRLTLGGLFLAVFAVLLAAPGSLADQPYVVRPVESPADILLLPATAWPPPESETGEVLLKLSYLRGLMDALQYLEVAPQGGNRVLKGLKGMTLNQLAAAVDRYYLFQPERRDLPPAAVVFRVLPAENESKLDAIKEGESVVPPGSAWESPGVSSSDGSGGGLERPAGSGQSPPIMRGYELNPTTPQASPSPVDRWKTPGKGE